MANRRAHGECGPREGGCEVVVGASCGGRRGVRRGRWVGRLGMGVRRIETSLVMWVVGLLVMSFVVNLCFAIGWYISEQ